VLLGPSKVATDLATIECVTTYPFGHVLRYNISSAHGFNLYVRVPEWYQSSVSSIAVNDSSATPLSPDANTGMHKVRVAAGQTIVTYNLGAAVRTEPRANDTVAVYYGSLLYALDVGSTNTSSNPHAYNDARGAGFEDLPFPQVRDFYVQNTTAWNVAIDPTTLEYHGIQGGVVSLPTPLFEYGAPPNYMTVKGCQIAWDLYLGSPGPVPTDRTCLGKDEMFRLVPYGSAKVHMSELPVVKLP
jgi:hypothetical protein